MMKYLAMILLACTLVAATGCPPLEKATVARVIDGDTIVLESGEKVRYIGIDAPELTPNPEPHAGEATSINRSLVEGKEIIMQRDVTDRDSFGRLLRYVYVGDLFINGEMVRLGMARSVEYPPDTKYQVFLNEMELGARTVQRGIWQNEGGSQ